MTSEAIYYAALDYIECGYSIIPVVGKLPAIQWAKYQVVRTPFSHVHHWQQTGQLQGIGIICGQVSNLVVIDLDGNEAVQTFRTKFPNLCETYTVNTGSGAGQHLYYRTTQPTVTTRTKTNIGGFELRSDGCYVVAPPSIHPSGKPYTIADPMTPVMKLDNLDNVRSWIMHMIRAKQPTIQRTEPRPVASGQNPRWVNAAVNRELSNIASATEGDANNILNAVSYRLARICANAHSGLVESNIKADLIEAAQHLTARDGLRSTLATIESGWNAGITKPAHIPEPRQSNGTRN